MDRRPLAGRSLLAVFAHPDDESIACGGLLARCADLGARVSLVCATAGEAGPGGGAALAEIRTRELQQAALVLGVSDLTLLGYGDGMLPWTEAARFEADIRAAIRRVDADVVVTFGEDGLYWHPDHIAVHDRTTAAVASFGAEAPALYYVTMPPGRMRALVERVSARAGHPVPPRILGVGDPDAFGAFAASPTLVIEAGALAARKLRALRCHQTQVSGDVMDLVSEEDALTLLGTEHYRRAPLPSGHEPFIEQLTHA